MSSFPQLKTGAACQYPLRRTEGFQTQVLRFLNGSEQRYREYTAGLKRWVIRLDLLDAREVAEVEEFFAGELGRFGSFEFTDPVDGVVYPSCSFDSDELEIGSLDEFRHRTTLVIRQNRT